MRQAAFTQIASSLPQGWSHYVELLTLEDPSERSFYEIEAASNQWSVRELQRQIASSLYQRLALSRDTNEIHRLAGARLLQHPGDEGIDMAGDHRSVAGAAGADGAADEGSVPRCNCS